MGNYRFTQHKLSDAVIDYAAKSAISANKLRNSKYGYNYSNILPILEQRAETDKATLEDLAVAEKLYKNVTKMSHAKRARVDYESLKSRAKNVYSQLYTADLVEDRAEDAAKLQNVVAMDSYRKPSRKAGKVSLWVLSGIGAAAIAVGGLISSYYTKQGNTPTTVQTEAPATKAPTPVVTAPAPAPSATLTAPTAPRDSDKKPNGGAAIEASETKSQRPSVVLELNYYSNPPCNPFDNLFSSTAPAPASQDGVSEAYKNKPVTAPATTAPAPAPAPKQEKADKNLDNLRDAARRVKANEKARASVEQAPDFVPPPAYIRVQKAEAAPSAPAQPARNVPAYKLTPPTDSGNTTVKAIVNLEGYTDAETIGGTGTGKVTVDLGKIGFNAYANGFATSQKFDTSDVDGNGSRFWASAHGYVPVSPKLNLYGELGGGIENRIYDVHFDSGSDFSYGDSSSFVNAKLGLTEGPIHNEDFGVGASHSYLLAQFTKNWGKATGDVKDAGFGDDYDATRASIKGRLMVAPELSVEAGCAIFAEKFAEFLEQNYWTAQTGVRWHAGKGDGFVELLAVYQDMESTVVGNESNDRRVGPEVGAGWRVFSGDNVTIDTTVSAGYLFSKEAENEWFANWGLTFYFGKKGK